MATARTIPLYQSDQTATSGESVITDCSLLSEASEAIQQLFGGGTAEQARYLVTTEATVFHPQGGGQPSDVGTMRAGDAVLRVTRVRQSTERPGVVLHCGHLADGAELGRGAHASQHVAARRRALHSRLHTAGHVLGLAVQALVAEGAMAPAPDGRASHSPEAAWVEFKGRIESATRPAIQAKVDHILALDLPILVHDWSPAQASAKCTGVPEGGLKTDGGDGDSARVRVIEIDGFGSYPCGGTHLPRTGDVGSVEVRTIKRVKDITKITYRVGNTDRTRSWDQQAAEADKTWMSDEQLKDTETYLKAYFKDEA